MTSYDHSLAAKASWNASAVVVSSLSRLFAGVAIARLLGPDQNGKFAFLLWLVEFLVMVFGMGLPSLLTRFLSLKLGQGEAAVAKCIMQISLRVGFVLTLLAAITTFGLSLNFLKVNFVPPELATPLALLVATQLWTGLTHAILTGLQNFRSYARVMVISSLILVVCQTVGGIGWGLNGAIYGTLASYGVGAVISFRAVAKTDLWKMGLTSIKSSVDYSVVAYARDAWLAGLISALVWGRAELFFLDRFSSSRETGYFAVGLVFSSLVVQAVNLVSGTILPHLSYLVGVGQIERLHKDYRRLTLLIALFTFPLALGGITLMPEIVELFFGLSYVEATPCAQWLMATGLLAFATVGSSVVYGHGDAHIIRNWSVLGACLLALLCTFLAPVAGAAGVSAARFIVQTLLIAIGLSLIRRRYGLPIPFRELFMFFAAAICCCVVALLSSQLAGSGAPGIFVGIICGATSYSLMLRMFGVVSAEDGEILRNLLTNLPPVLGRPLSLFLLIVRAR